MSTLRTPPSLSDIKDLTGCVARKSDYSIGRGGFSDIWAASCLVDGVEQEVAIKVLRSFADHTSTAAQKLDKRLRKELLVWKSLQHKHVLPLIGIIRDFGPHVSMVCPWMEKGSLTQHLAQHGVNLDLRRRLQLVREVASGLAYLHSKEVVHGDLTGYNILLDKNDRIHISDFGFATIAAQFRDTSLDSSSVSGAIRWMDPVCVFGQRSTMQSDIYSFGSIMYHIFTNQVPYHDIKKEPALILQLQKYCHPDRPHYPPISQVYWDLMLQCWDKSPFNRPTLNIIRARLRRLRHSPRYSHIDDVYSSSSSASSPLASPHLALPIPSSPPLPSSSVRFQEPLPVISRPPTSPLVIRRRQTSSPAETPHHIGQSVSPSEVHHPRPLRHHVHPLRHAVTWPSPKPSSPDQSLRMPFTPPTRASSCRLTTCTRCGDTFKKYPSDTDVILIHQGICQYHSGRIVDAASPLEERRWSCCSRKLRQPGCCSEAQHYSED